MGAYFIRPKSWVKHGVPRPQHPGMQMMHFEQSMRRVSCQEYGCEWFMFGREGADAGFPFVHPVGVACGDFRGCAPCQRPIYQGGKKRLCGTCMPCKVGTSNCPCAGNEHWLPDERFDDRYQVATAQGVRPVVASEWKDRLGEGVYALHHIKTRGL